MAANPVTPLPKLQVDRQTVDDTMTVVCHGRIDTDTVATLQSAVRKVIPETKRVVLDLGDVHYMDSAGLGALVGLYASARRNGTELKLANLTPRIVDLLRITHLASIFEP